MKKLMYGGFGILIVLVALATMAAKPNGITHLTSLWVGDSTDTADVTPGDNDLFVSGDVEIDGTLYPDSGIDYKVSAKTGDYTLSASDAGTIFTNRGATSMITFWLPSATTVPGKPFMFALEEAHPLAVVPATGTNRIKYTGLSLDCGDKIVADDDGESIVLVAGDSTAFVPLASSGTWLDGGK